MTTPPAGAAAGYRLDGAVALVTGGSRGIGRATAVAMAVRGAHVVAVSRHPARPDGDFDGRIEPMAGDVADGAGIARAMRRVLESYGRVDVLVNCAGVPAARASVWEVEPETFQYVLAVNTLGPFHLMRLVLPGMIERGSGVVINVSSGAGTRPRARRSVYGASKAALDHLTCSAAQEVAAFGVRVYAFYPGPVDTDLFAASRMDPSLTSGEREAVEARVRAGELQAPEEPAAALAWLATPAGAAYRDVIVRWREPATRKWLRNQPGFVLPGPFPR